MIETELLKRYIINGASLDKQLNRITKTNGFMVSKIGYETTHKPNAYAEIKADILTKKHLLKTNEYIGIWEHNGLVYIDISKHYKQRKDAIINGIKNKQYSIYDLKKQKDIELLQHTYILYKVKKINDKYISYHNLKNNNDLSYIKEYYNIDDLKNDFNMNYNTLKQYIIKDTDKPFKKILNNRYIIVMDNEYIREINEL